MSAAVEQWDLVTLGQENPGNWYIVAQNGRVIADFPKVAQIDWKQQADDIRLISVAPELLATCRAQHQAIDSLMAQLIATDPSFRPTKSAVWATVVMGSAAMAKATGSAE